MDREIVEVEQAGKKRASYGDDLLRGLAAKFTKRFGKGFSAPNLRNMRRFYATFPRGVGGPGRAGRSPKTLGSA